MSKKQEHKQAQVIERFGNSADIFYENKVFRSNIKRALTDLAVGDFVEFEDKQTNLIINKILKRKSAFKRVLNFKQKTIAANIDIAAIVVAIEPAIDFSLLDRYILLAKQNNIQPLIIINKIELCDARYLQKFDIYKQLAVSIIPISCYQDERLDKLQEAISNKNVMLFGQSGVGKSTIINKLLKTNFLTNSLSSINQGKHTTTSTKLLYINDNFIIDSPGNSSFDISFQNDLQIREFFPDLEIFFDKCKFNNCRHLSEPNCVFKALLEDENYLNKERVLNYINFYNTL